MWKSHGRVWSIRETFDREWVAPGRLEARTPQTIVDRDKFFEHLRGVASEGVALDQEELEEGLCCVAAPVYDAAGRVVAALSVSGPAFRLAEGTLRMQVAPVVQSTAKTLSAQLGYA